MALTKGDVVLVLFPFTNLQQTKLRPATVERNLIAKRLGKLGVGQLQQLNIAMIQAFQL